MRCPYLDVAAPGVPPHKKGVNQTSSRENACQGADQRQLNQAYPTHYCFWRCASSGKQIHADDGTIAALTRGEREKALTKIKMVQVVFTWQKSDELCIFF